MREKREPCLRLIAALVLASLVGTNVLAGAGEYRCRYGMVEAGPDCPMCHGSEGAPAATSLEQACCEFVQRVPAQAVTFGAKEQLSLLSAAALPTQHPGQASPISRSITAPDVFDRDVGPPSPTRPLILRL